MKPPHALDAGKGRLRKLVSASPKQEPKLPLVHTTDTYDLSEIVESGLLKASPCDVFEPEEIVYLFYGRPSFRPNSNIEPLSLNHYFPICLIFSPELMVNISRIFPFDSGAFQLDLYSAYVHKKMKLGDFGLDPDPSSPGRVVTKYFDDNDSYMKGQPTPNCEDDPSEFESHTLSAIYNAKQSNSMDSRNSSIEVQLNDDLDLYSHLQAVIFPEVFDQAELGAELRARGITTLPYPIMGRSAPTEYMGSIHMILLRYYNSD